MRLESHCSSGPIKLGIFDIYRSTLTQSNCLGLSSSIFLNVWVFFAWNILDFFWIHVCIYSLILKLVSMHPKIILENKWVTYFKKSKGWRFDFRGPKLF